MKTLRTVLFLATIAVVILDGYLLTTGAIRGWSALLLLVCIELPLFGILLSLSWIESRKQRVPLVSLMPPLAFVTYEIHAWSDLSKLLRKVTQTPPGATEFTSRTGVWQLPCMFSVAVVIEIVVVDYLVSWTWLRLVLLVLSLYPLGLLWGTIAAKVVYPHYTQTREQKLVLRRGREIVIEVPLSNISQIACRRGFYASEHEIEGDSLRLGGPSGTNVHVKLHSPQDAVHGRWPWQPPRSSLVGELEFFVDQPVIAVQSIEAARAVQP